MIPFFAFQLLDFDPVGYLLFGILIFPHPFPIQILEYLQFHIFLLLEHKFLAVLLHHPQDIFRIDTVFESVAYLVELYPVSMFFFLLFEPIDEQSGLLLLAFLSLSLLFLCLP